MSPPGRRRGGPECSVHPRYGEKTFDITSRPSVHAPENAQFWSLLAPLRSYFVGPPLNPDFQSFIRCTPLVLHGFFRWSYLMGRL